MLRGPILLRRDLTVIVAAQLPLAIDLGTILVQPRVSGHDPQAVQRPPTIP